MFCIDRASLLFAYGHQFVVAVGFGVGFFLVVRRFRAAFDALSLLRKVPGHE